MVNQRLLNRIRVSRIETFLFYGLFILFFSLNTQLSNYYLATARWGVLFLFVFYNVYKKGITGSSIINSGIIWFTIMLIPSIPAMLGNTYMLARAISFVIVVMGFSICLSQPSTDGAREKQYFEWFSNVLILGCLALTPFIFISSGYLAGRFRGYMTNANGCALITIFALICIIYRMKYSNHKVRYYVLWALFFVIVILTQSRMAFVIAAVLFVMLPFLLSKKRTVISSLVQIFLIGIMVVLCYFVINHLSFGAVLRFEEAGSSRDIWEYAYERIRQEPVFGRGFSYSSYMQGLFPLDLSWSVHSSYLELLVDCGFYGLVCTISFFAKRLIKPFTNIRKDDFSLFLFMLVAVGLVMGISESYLFAVGNPLSFSFWFAFLLLVNYTKHAGE